MKRIALVALTGFLAATAPVVAADVEVGAPIRSVVVYPLGASITRQATFAIPVGVNVLVIGNIPPAIDTSSIRVEGLADVGLEIRSVEAQTAKIDAEQTPERTRLLDAIQDLRDRQGALGDQLTALQGQRTFIQNLINEGPAGFAEFLGAGGGIDQWAAAWQTIGRGLEQVLSGLREVALEQRDLERQIAALNVELAALPVPTAALEIRVEVAAAAAGNGTLTVTYQVGNARWVPAYDAMLTTGADGTEPAIALVRRAEITQQTGEDWVDVALTLSTSRPAGGTQAPFLDATIVRIYDPGRRFAAPPAPAAEAAARDQVAGALGGAIQATEQQAIADFGDFKADFIIQGPVSVASGGGVRSVRIATDHAPARLLVAATPRLAEQAFLTAAFTLDSGAPILAGRANLFRDGAYVGTGGLAFSNAGAEVELGFGPDDLVRVTFALVSRETGERGLLTRINTDERLYRMTVENLHTRAIEITVTDRIPVAEDERIVVDGLPATTRPTEEDVDGRRGVMAWTYEYAPGETRTIDNAYLVTWPTDLAVTGLD